MIPTQWLFPMSKKELEELLSENPRTSKNDFKTLYLFVIAKMKEAGVTFSSPGASKGRRFLYWFNSHFWSESFDAMKFERDDFAFKEIYSLLAFDSLEVSIPADALLSEYISIENGHKLHELGKTLILKIPFFRGKNVEFL